jgi:hypothetical protein
LHRLVAAITFANSAISSHGDSLLLTLRAAARSDHRNLMLIVAVPLLNNFPQITWIPLVIFAHRSAALFDGL